MGFSKLIISGTLIELYQYAKPLPERRPTLISKRATKAQKKALKTTRYRRADHVYRARKNFYRLVRANTRAAEPPLFITLTHRENVSLKTAVANYTRFISLLRRRYPDNHIKHIAVPEFQERDAPHFHTLIYGLPITYGCTNKKGKAHRFCRNRLTCEVSLRRFQSLWLWGYVDVRATDGHPKIAGYMAKYMLKALQDIRLSGEKAYYASRHCVRQVCLTLSTTPPQEIRLIGPDNPPISEREFETDWLGKCVYQRYNRAKDLTDEEKGYTL